MAVSTEFYKVVNDIMATAIGEQEPEFTFESFVDYGKKLNQLTNSDLANNFLTPLMQRIASSIDTYRTYRDKFSDLMTVGGMGLVQILTHKFYNSTEAKFANLVDGQSYPFDLYRAPQIEADYFTYSVANDFELSYSFTELRASFDSPETMYNFVDTLTGDMWNSVNYSTESVSRNHLASSIYKAMDSTPVTSINGYGIRYNVLSMFNNFTNGDLVTAETALSSKEFMAFFAQVIKLVGERMKDRTTSFNDNGVDSFIYNDEDLKLYMLSTVKTAIDVNTVNAFNPSGLNINAKIVNFWQTPESIYVVNEDDGDESDPVLAVMFDKYHLIRQIELEASDTVYNPKGRFFTDFVHLQMKYIVNNNANRVVFALA